MRPRIRTAPDWMALWLEDRLLMSPIPPEVRGIAVACTDSVDPLLRVYYDQEPTVDQQAMMRSIVDEHCVGPDDDPVTVCFSASTVPDAELQLLDEFIYFRQEASRPGP